MSARILKHPPKRGRTEKGVAGSRAIICWTASATMDPPQAKRPISTSDEDLQEPPQRARRDWRTAISAMGQNANATSVNQDELPDFLARAGLCGWDGPFRLAAARMRPEERARALFAPKGRRRANSGATAILQNMTASMWIAMCSGQPPFLPEQFVECFADVGHSVLREDTWRLVMGARNAEMCVRIREVLEVVCVNSLGTTNPPVPGWLADKLIEYAMCTHVASGVYFFSAWGTPFGRQWCERFPGAVDVMLKRALDADGAPTLHCMVHEDGLRPCNLEGFLEFSRRAPDAELRRTVDGKTTALGVLERAMKKARISSTATLTSIRSLYAARGVGECVDAPQPSRTAPRRRKRRR